MNLLIIVLGLAALAVVVYASYKVGTAFWRARGERLVECPETHAPAGVSLDAKGAARAALRGQRHFELEKCTRWPERAGCGQDCLQEIAAAPDGCRVQAILAAWYVGKACVLCGRDLSRIDWTVHRPALMDPARKIVQWGEMAAVDVPGLLETHLPVCWDCQIIESLVQQHPERVTVRPPH